MTHSPESRGIKYTVYIAYLLLIACILAQSIMSIRISDVRKTAVICAQMEETGELGERMIDDCYYWDLINYVNRLGH